MNIARLDMSALSWMRQKCLAQCSQGTAPLMPLDVDQLLESVSLSIIVRD